MNKTVIKGAYVTLALAFMLAALVIFWLVYPYKTYELRTLPIPVSTTAVKSGEEMTLYLDYCIYSSAKNRVIVRLVGDGSRVVLSDTTRESSVTGCGTSNLALRIPSNTSKGAYTIEIWSTYFFNPIRQSEAETVTSLPFSVVE